MYSLLYKLLATQPSQVQVYSPGVQRAVRGTQPPRKAAAEPARACCAGGGGSEGHMGVDLEHSPGAAALPALRTAV